MDDPDFINDAEVQAIARRFVQAALVDPMGGSALLRAAATVHACLAAEQADPATAINSLLEEHEENARNVLDHIISQGRQEA